MFERRQQRIEFVENRRLLLRMHELMLVSKKVLRVFLYDWIVVLGDADYQIVFQAVQFEALDEKLDLQQKIRSVLDADKIFHRLFQPRN